MWWTDTKWWKYEYSKWKDLRGVSSEEWSYANPQYRSVWSISLDFPRMIHFPFCWFIRIFKLSPHIFPNHKNGPYKFVLQVHHSQLASLTNRLMSLMANGKWQTGQEVQDNKQSNKQTNKLSTDLRNGVHRLGGNTEVSPDTIFLLYFDFFTFLNGTRPNIKLQLTFWVWTPRD